MSTINIQEATLGSVLGAPGDPNGGIFIGKLSGISGRKMRKRLLYPTYANSTGKNVRVKNSLNESDEINENYLYTEEGTPVTEAYLNEITEGLFDTQTAFKGGSFIKVEPKCMAFPYCNQGAIDKPIKLIHGSKEGMCESCHDYCKSIGEQVGKDAEWVAEGFRKHTLKKLEEITTVDKRKVDQLLMAIQHTIEPSLFDKIRSRIAMAIIDPYATYDEILQKVKAMIPSVQQQLAESVESVDNKKQQNITEMIRVKSLALDQRKAIMEALMASPLAECMQSQLQTEGFLPLSEELTDGLTMEASFKAIMEDADICNEMFDTLMESDCECKDGLREWLKENDFLDNEPEEDGSEDDGAEEETPAEEPESSEPETDVTPAEPETNVDPEASEIPADAAATDTEDALDVPADADPTPGAEDAGADEMQTLVDTLVSLQTKYAGNEEDSELLSSINDMLNQAKSLKTMTGVETAEEPVATDSAVAAALDSIEPSAGDEPELDIAVGGQEEEPTDAPEAIEEAAGGATRKPMDQDFIDRVNKFKELFLDDLKWNSLKTYYHLAPEVQPQDIHTYLSPKPDENGLGFIQRITNLQNDPTGINRMLFNLMNPAKRGYIEKFGNKYNPEFLDGLEDLMSDLWSKYQSIQAMLNGTHSPLDGDDEDGVDGEETGYAKDDFEDEFNANSEDNIDAQAAAAAKASPAINPAVADDSEEEDPMMENVDEDEPVRPKPKTKGYADGEDEDYSDESHLDEAFKPLMGDGVFTDNKKGEQETMDQAKAAEDSQKTEDQKVDELKNQKFEASEAQATIANKQLGQGNNLDLDYDQELTPERKAQILQQASGTAPKDHANVDHDSTAGQQLIDAAKARSGETTQQFSSIPDNTTIEKKEKYEVTTAVNEDIDRMRKLMSFDVTKLKEERRRQKFNEEKFLTEKVQTKKFL